MTTALACTVFWEGFLQDLKYLFSQVSEAEYFVYYDFKNTELQYYRQHRPTTETPEASVRKAVEHLVALAAGWVTPRAESANLHHFT